MVLPYFLAADYPPEEGNNRSPHGSVLPFSIVVSFQRWHTGVKKCVADGTRGCDAEQNGNVQEMFMFFWEVPLIGLCREPGMI